MTTLDVVVLLLYMVGLLAIGVVFAFRTRSSQEMFAAGGRAPWWMSGLSMFMTVFSAGTFVVWGGIAYRLGLVSVSILACSGGVSTLVAGHFLAGRWHRLGVTTPAEYINLRFGKATVQTYTWLNLISGCIAMAVGLYSLSVMVAAMIPLSPGNLLADPATGTLAVGWAIVIGGGIVVAYTMAGGLWAVLTTDVVQCVVLSLVVLMVAPLSLAKVGGLANFIAEAPKGFLRPVGGQYTWIFLFFWVLINIPSHGGQWAFVQRFICVPTEKDARKAAYLTGVLFLICPVVWMLPAMVYRVMEPDAPHQQAYILVCRDVLPAGMLGMTLAAMFSATASMMSSLLNVFAGVFTRDVYLPLVRPESSEAHLVAVGRTATVIYGGMVVVLALCMPWLGGAEKVVLSLVMLVIGPMVIPSIWGLFSSRTDEASVWATVVSTAAIAGGVKLVLWQGLLADSALFLWIADHRQLTDAMLGLLVPLTVMLVMELRARGTSRGWQRLSEHVARHEEHAVAASVSMLPAVIVAATVWALAALTLALAITADEQAGILFVFSALLLAVGAAIVWVCRGIRRVPQPPPPSETSGTP